MTATTHHLGASLISQVAEETDSDFDDEPVAGPSTLAPPTIEGEIEGDFEYVVPTFLM